MASKKQSTPKTTKTPVIKAKAQPAEQTEQWTSGQVIRDGAEADKQPRKDTGKYDARQWVGEGQGAKQPESGQQWTSGQVISDEPEAGKEPRKDTGQYQTDQWVGEGQGTEAQPAEKPHTKKS